MFRRARFILIILVLLVGGSLPMVMAARLQQARVRKLKACVAIIPTPTDPDAIASPNRYPYVFYVLDQQKNLKPDGWEFHNPASPAFSTAAQQSRWGPGLVEGTQLRPDMAPYWEVVLSPANFDRLAQMDVIYIPIFNLVTEFTEEHRRMLTRLADGGVAVWIDWTRDAATQNGILGGTNPQTRNPFFTNLDFQTFGNRAIDPQVGHPLLTAQYVFKPGDSVNLGLAYGMNPPSQGRAVEMRAADMQPTANFSAVVPLQGVAPQVGAYVAATRYGAGFVVATAGNVGGAIGKMFPPPNFPNPPGAVIQATNQDIGQAEEEDVKFAYNLFAWTSEVTAQQKNGRHTGQGSVQINGMVEHAAYPYLFPSGTGQWPWQQYPPPGLASTAMPTNPTSPLIINGMVVSATRYQGPNGPVSKLDAFEINPNDDFDGNMFQDDGSTTGGGTVDAATPPPTDFATFVESNVDQSVGLPYDRVMNITVPLIMGMTVADIPEPAAASPQGANGYLFAAGESTGVFSGLYSLPAPRPGQPPASYWNSGSPKQAPTNVNIDYTGAPAVASIPGPGTSVVSHVYAGGLQSTGGIFGSATQGKLVAFNIAPDGSFNNGALPTPGAGPAWYYPPTAEANRVGVVSGPVVTAQVEDRGTGAIDTMVFITTTSSGDPSGGQVGGQAGDTTGKVEGFIVSTKGDLLGFPRGNTAPGGGNPTAGRRFVSVRWLDVPPGVGPAPQARELMWDPTKYWEVRVINRATGYVTHRYTLNQPNGAMLLPDGTAGQVELPAPPMQYQETGQPNVWDLDRALLLADYSPLPIPVDQSPLGGAGLTIRPRFSPATPYERGAGPGNQVKPTGIAGGVAVGRDNLVYYGTGIGYMCAAEWRRGRAHLRWKMRATTPDFNPDGGQQGAIRPSDPDNHLPDYAFVSAPTAGDRIVFATRGRGGPGTVYVFEPDATIRFKLQAGAMTPAQAQEVMIEGDHGSNFNPTSPFLMASMQPWGRLPNQFVVDPDTSTVTFLNMENFSLNLNLVRSPGQLAAMGIDTGGKPAVPINWQLRSQPGVARPPAWIPLPIAAIYRATAPVPDGWMSGAVVSGDRIYLMGRSGFLHELPLDPKTVEPAFPRLRDNMGNPVPGLTGFDMGNLGLYGPFGLRKTRNVAHDPAQAGLTMAMASPAISQGIVAVTTRRGLTMYGSPNIVVADSNRVVEASGDSAALATTDVAVKHRIDTSEFAIPTDPTFANTVVNGVRRPILTERKLLSRPAVVRKLSRGSSLTAIFKSTSQTIGPVDDPSGIREHSELAEESYLIADPGNNRCAEFNPAGKVVWECMDFQDPFKYLPAGESLKLSGPMDVQRWIELERVGSGQNAPTVYVIHTLITDTGNHRIVEIVDKVLYQRGSFDAGSFVTIQGQNGADGQPIRWYHVLVWSSQTNAQGLRLRYRNAQRIFWPDGGGNLLPTGVQGSPNAPIPASTTPPYLPLERFLSYTMATISGQQVFFRGGGVRWGGFNLETSPTAPQSIIERKPEVRPGGDSIVFLRGLWKVERVDPGSFTPIVEPTTGVRQDRPGVSAGGDRYRFDMGVIDPNVLVINEIVDEHIDGYRPPPLLAASNNMVHRLSGITSIQRTIRRDAKFGSGSGGIGRFMYFLVTDRDGVWEIRMYPGQGPIPPEYRLAWAFTIEDYAYVTGAGNGNPTAIFTPPPPPPAGGLPSPGGRRLSAVSARRLPNGFVLISSRTPENPNSAGQTLPYLGVGADVFLLRSTDYMTAKQRQDAGQAAPYNRTTVGLHGWRPDLWVQNPNPPYGYGNNVPPALRGAPSIRWRAAEQADSLRPPTYRTPTPMAGGNNPLELAGTYVPVQPNYADLVY
jgi:hypothetical protein